MRLECLEKLDLLREAGSEVEDAITHLTQAAERTEDDNDKASIIFFCAQLNNWLNNPIGFKSFAEEHCISTRLKEYASRG